MAVKSATTPAQIKLAERDLDSNLTKVVPFFAYVDPDVRARPPPP